VIRKVKNWLGIEGVKIQLEVPANLKVGQKELRLVLSLSALSDQKIKNIHLSLKEIYSRGNGKNRRISEFILAEWEQEKSIKIGKQAPCFLPILLQPNWQYSAFDKWQKEGALQNYMGLWAKKLNSVKSEYLIEVNIDVAKTKLNPYHVTRLIFSD